MKLKLLKLRSAVVLSDPQKKAVRGGNGYGYGDCYIHCREGSRDYDVAVTSCHDRVWPCGHGNGWNCTGC